MQDLKEDYPLKKKKPTWLQCGKLKCITDYIVYSFIIRYSLTYSEQLLWASRNKISSGNLKRAAYVRTLQEVNSNTTHTCVHMYTNTALAEMPL